MTKLGIVGLGFVGKAYQRYFQDHYDLVIYDPMYPELNTKEEVNECEYALVCVPTPMKDDGSCDLSIIEKTLEWLEVPHIMIKSTILPGTTKKLVEKYNKSIVFSPEYIGEGKYWVPFWKYPHPTDAKQHGFVIIGGERDDRIPWLEVFKKVVGPDTHYLQTDSTTAELVKYGENSWGATKVVLFNEFFDICNAFGVEFDEFRELLLHDKRIERMHTAVFRDNRGFGGKCLPKDVNGIVRASTKAGYKPELLAKVLEVNKKIRGGK